MRKSNFHHSEPSHSHSRGLLQALLNFASGFVDSSKCCLRAPVAGQPGVGLPVLGVHHRGPRPEAAGGVQVDGVARHAEAGHLLALHTAQCITMTMVLVRPGTRGTPRPGTPRPCRGNTGNTAPGAHGPGPAGRGRGVQLQAFCHFTQVQIISNTTAKMSS